MPPVQPIANTEAQMQAMPTTDPGGPSPVCKPATWPSDAANITRLLQGWSAGDPQALDRLVPLVYDELQRLARRHMRHERPNHTLQCTGLVHEAFMRMAASHAMQWATRAQFFGWASLTMRRILVDHSRRRNAERRGGGIAAQSLDALQEASGTPSGHPAEADAVSILKLDEALIRLARIDPRKSSVVEHRFFGGLSVEETAEAMNLSTATVKREWAAARAWLLHDLSETAKS